MKISKEKNHKRLFSKDKKKSYSLSSILIDTEDFFIHHEILEPFKETSSPHYHKDTDEFVYVLKGKVIAREGDESILLEEGDSVCFQKSLHLLHVIENPFHEVAEVLVIKKSFFLTDVVYN